MLEYDISPAVEAFSTNIADSTDFDVVLPLHQSHGTESVIVNTADDVNRTFGVDALITQTPGLRIGVKTADCVPVLLHDGATRTVAAIHSGWKGTLADIIGATVGRMAAECGVAPANISAVIGPASTSRPSRWATTCATFSKRPVSAISAGVCPGSAPPTVKNGISTSPPYAGANSSAPACAPSTCVPNVPTPSTANSTLPAASAPPSKSSASSPASCSAK